MTSTVEAFLLIEQPRQRSSHWAASLASLDSPLAPTPIAVVAYYDPSSDQALLNLQYDQADTGDAGLDFLVQVALLAEVGMVQPAVLSEGERARFLAARLSRCTIRVTNQKSAVGALGELVRMIRAERAPQAALEPPPIPLTKKKVKVPMPARPTLSVAAPKGAPPDDPVFTAKGTRDNMQREAIAALRLPATDMDYDGIPEIDVDDAPDSTPLLAPDASRNLIPRASRLPTVTMEPEVIRELTATNADDSDRITAPMALDRLQALAKAEDVKRMPPPLRPPTENDFAEEDDVKSVTVAAIPNLLRKTARSFAPLQRRAQSEPYLTTSQQANIIYARYLRGGRWIPVRVGALSLKGAALLAGALPRVDDRVDVALTFGTHRALVRGLVAKVSTPRESQSSGAATFSVTFKLDEVSKRQLTALLVAARDAKITIKPPPARATRRFPVEWHIALGTTKGAVKAVALDVSTGGMFVRSPFSLELDAVLNFSVVLDDGGAPIAGRCKVVRRITDAEARTCGLAPGFGLEIVDMSEADRMRWLGFLARIERRTEKRVLIGAEPARLAELQAGLASLGYAVCGGTDPGTLVQLANSDTRLADAVLIDAGWLQNEASSTLVESLFSARNVPCVTMHGEVRRARQAIDRLLEVVV